MPKYTRLAHLYLDNAPGQHSRFKLTWRTRNERSVLLCQIKQIRKLPRAISMYLRNFWKNRSVSEFRGCGGVFWSQKNACLICLVECFLRYETVDHRNSCCSDVCYSALNNGANTEFIRNVFWRHFTWQLKKFWLISRTFSYSIMWCCFCSWINSFLSFKYSGKKWEHFAHSIKN